MKQRIRAVLLGNIGILLCALPSHGQTVVNANDLQLDEVEVTAQRTQVQSEPYKLIAQISSEEIGALPISDIADILAFLPGIDVRSRGASAVQSDISLRGGTFDQVLILLNGISIADAQTGHYALNIPLNPALIERIEILDGPGANLTGAFSGAINIITREAPKDTYTIQLCGGSNGEISPAFAGSWCRDNVRVNSSVEFARSNGYYAPMASEKEQVALRNSDYRLLNAYLQTRWQGLDIQAGVQWKDAGLGMGYGFGSQDQFDATRIGLLTANYGHRFNDHWSLTAQVAYRAHYDRYEWHRGSVTNRHWTHNTQAVLRMHYTSRIGRTAIGAEVHDDYISSTSMGLHNRLHATLSAEQWLIWKGLTASVGIAGHYNTLFGWQASGAAHIGYSFLHTGSVHLSARRSLRMPTWTDLYYDAGNQRGDEHLQAETAWQLSVGGQYTWQWEQAGRLSITGNAYYRWGRDIIDWVYTQTDAVRPYHATNQQRVDAAGVELTATYHYNDWLRQLTVSYAYTHLSLDLQESKSRYLDYLRHKLIVNINHGIYVWENGCLGAGWTLRWQDRMGQYNDADGQEQDFRPVLLLNGAIYIEFPYTRIELSCDNMTNRHYYDYGGVLMPGACGLIKITNKF